MDGNKEKGMRKDKEEEMYPDAAVEDIQRSAEADEEDFSLLFEQSLKKKKRGTRVDSKITGTVVSIGEEWAFVDMGEKSEGIIATQELLDEKGNPVVGVGDEITAYVVKKGEGETVLSIKMTSAASGEALEGAYRSGLPVEGIVAAERKGGYQVKVFGREAFCPYSQIDLRGVSSPDGYVRKRFVFRITVYEKGGRNIVLSRRQILEEEREKRIQQLRETIHVGDVVSGTVAKLVPYGAFVDIGGIEGLIPMSELAWQRVESPSDVLAPGETVRVKVLDLDWKGGKISLSRKALQEDPRTTLAERYREGAMLTGEVVRLMPFGAFVKLPEGETGLLHTSEMAGDTTGDLRRKYPLGSSVRVQVVKVDSESGKIALSTKGIEAVDEGQAFKAYQAGKGGSGSFGTLASAFKKAGKRRGDVKK